MSKRSSRVTAGQRAEIARNEAARKAYARLSTEERAEVARKIVRRREVPSLHVLQSLYRGTYLEAEVFAAIEEEWQKLEAAKQEEAKERAQRKARGDGGIGLGSILKSLAKIPTRSKGGRPRKKIVDRLLVIAGMWMADEGIPDKGERAKLEAALAEHATGELGETRIKEIAAQAVEIATAYRRSGRSETR